MKQKDMYTLEELFDSLDISLAKLSKIANVNESTLSRIRDGYPTRVETANKLLKAFSEVYELELSRKNVTGITLEDKKAIRQQMLKRKGITEKVEKQPVPSPVVQTTSPVAEKPEKRVYKGRDTALPNGAILASEFAEAHNVKRPTFIAHMTTGIGPDKEKVEHEHPDNPKRKGEVIRYLTNKQQRVALDYWQRYNVSFTECNIFGCWCHDLLQEDK